MVVAVASGVVRMPALNMPVVDIRQHRAQQLLFRVAAHGQLRGARPAGHEPTIVAKKNRAHVTWTSE